MSEHEKRLREHMKSTAPHSYDLEGARLLDAALAQARADALEEAAVLLEETQRLAVSAAEREDGQGRTNTAFVAEMRSSADVLETQAHRVRSLSTTPPASIPVAKVREVLNDIYETGKDRRSGYDQRSPQYAEHSGRMGAAFSAARDLGVPLDGGEVVDPACECGEVLSAHRTLCVGFRAKGTP